MWSTNVQCIGFGKSLYPIIKYAIIDVQITWIPETLIRSGPRSSMQFHWQDCIWELTDLNNMVESIRLVEGELTPELTAMVLAS